MASISIPAALSAASAVAGVASAAVGAAGAIQSGKAQSGAANYNAEIAQQNQQQALQNANLVSASGEQQAAVQEQKTRSEAGAIKAAQAASGVDVNSGSAVDVQSSAAETGQLNALTVRANAAREAYGYQTQSTSFEDQAQLDTAQAANATTAGDIGATGTFLGGVGSAAGNYAKFLQKNSAIVAGSDAGFWGAP
jgi:hypothetical protein